MTSDWKEYKIGDLCSRVTSGGTPKSTNAEYYVGGTIPWLNTKEVRFNRIYLTEKFITELGLNNSSAKWITANNVIVAMYGATAGNVAINKIPLTTNQACCNLEIDATKADYNFIYYYLLKNYNVLSSMANGGAQQNLNSLQIKDFDILLPPLETQRKIARVLGAIDDKIELNNSINKNLEQQAQAIYSNFIDNCENKIIKVSDITATANTGADAIQKAPIVDYDTGVKCIRVGDMSNNHDIYQWGYSKVTDDVFTQYQLKKDDILVTRTATLGLNRLITSDLNAVYNNGLIRLTVDKLKILPLILYRQFQTQDFFNFISRIESETSVRPNMKINYLLSYEFKCPDIDKQKELVDLITPIMNIKELNIQENNNLTQLRDTLLPKLMNGEIDVDKVEV